MKTIEVMLDKGAFIPERAHSVDAGLDLRSRQTSEIPAHGSAVFNTGIHINIPAGYVGFLKAKSGLNIKNNITGTGVVDAGYTGAIIVKLYNHGDEPYYIGEGDKLIQIVFLQVEIPEPIIVKSFTDYSISDRGDQGFGSSGK